MKQSINDNQIIFFNSNDGQIKIDVLYADENVWLTQKKMAELFETTTQNITLHLKHIYEDKELNKTATCKDYLQVQKEGIRTISRNLTCYSLEAIIAVGYRVKSERGIQFRQWATTILQKYIHKGFAINKERFIHGSKLDMKFFDELLEEIREIRTSERMSYQKITDIYATSIDYNSDVEITKEFFATVQNKLHFAITGHTAAEIIKYRADSNKKFMGLNTWKKAPKGKILPSDTTVAKNYLTKDELEHLNRIVSMYIDYAELQAVRHKVMYMKDWVEKLNTFLKYNEYDILKNLGKVSHEIAKELALKEYEKYRIVQDKNYISDFDREIEKIKNLKDKKKTKQK